MFQVLRKAFSKLFKTQKSKFSNENYNDLVNNFTQKLKENK